MIKKIFFALLIFYFPSSLPAQNSPCSDKKFRAFDFWIGNWEAFAKNGKKAGDSKISLVLDSCVVLEEWISTGVQSGIIYKGKSFNTYNTATQQWQQTWVDNTGNTTEFLRSEVSDGQIIFYADKTLAADGKTFMRRLTFTKINDNSVRQFGEKSDDEGKTWTTEYDLSYKRK